MSNVMLEPRISKITVNIGIGEGGEKLAKAEGLLETLTGQKPIRTYSKITQPTWAIRKGSPIACKVTLRNDKMEKFLKDALLAVDNKIEESHFDDHGNVSFGIKEHIDIPGIRYDPNIGIFGMDVSLTIERPGYRVKRRKVGKKKVSKTHRLNKDDTIQFMKKRYKIILED
ncbi:MAG: 50S ribosomal protein L5 [Candidatus Hydrothermarchaeales archaeon]